MKSINILFALLCITSLHGQYALTEFSIGYNKPVDLSHAGGEYLYIVEQEGTIKVAELDGSVLEESFLDIRDRVLSAESEQGLLGLAFHPNFAQNGYFYVNYTSTELGTVVSRFESENGSLTSGDSDSEQILLTIDQPFSNHNGGDLAFGQDGYLYITTGDGGSAGDPLNSGQDRLSLLGKILRIDVDCDQNYCIPTDNPFAFDDFTLDEIWSLGWRNPWRFSFDQETGDMWIADVGQNEIEEVNFEPLGYPGGGNYGWRCYEGSEEFNLSECNSEDFIFPVYEYTHSSGPGCSVTGGVVYRADGIPDLYGRYIYGDYCSGRIWSLTPEGSGYRNDFLLDYDNFQISAFGNDPVGQVYVLTLGAGIIYKLESTVSTEREFNLDRIEAFQNGNQLVLRASSDNKIDFALTNVSGREIMNASFRSQTAFSTSSYVKGLYFLKWTDGHASGMIKIILQ